MSNALFGIFSDKELLVLESYLFQNNKCNESELIKKIFKLLVRPEPDFYNQLDLFHAHFIIFNALHRLNEMNINKYYIRIELTRIELIDYKRLTNQTIKAIQKNDSQLIEYYLNVQHFHETSEAKINEMLQSFAKKFRLYLNLAPLPNKHLDWNKIEQEFQQTVSSNKINLELSQLDTQFQQLKKYKDE